MLTLAIIIGIIIIWVTVFYWKEKRYEIRLQRRREAISAWRKKGHRGKTRWKWTSLSGRRLMKVDKSERETKQKKEAEPEKRE